MDSPTSMPPATTNPPIDKQHEILEESGASEAPIEQDPSSSSEGAVGGAAETDGGDEEEEEEECGFCLFMKGGGCKEAFVAWERCVEEAERDKEDMVEKCYEVTTNLRRCMDAHSDYYEPILRAEKAMEEEAARELADQEGSPPSSADVVVVIEESSGGGDGK
ncbi:hypothetical protein QJS04_geneDACA000548 [Acorus gramineus]|uniref:GCK domain-containing protein n=1 Tax=Acorus gramineus TaxID=55184 RepID=A0AAV9ARV5_ACOGR|nr:hypothetical protein QJS04_geneDACA000548 [Acorus gramineus]